MHKISAGMGDKMKEKKEEYSYIVNRNNETKHKSRVRKVIAIFTTLSLLMGAFLLIDQLTPWIVFSKEEDMESVNKAEVESIREISLLDNKLTVPAALTKIEQITNDGTAVKVVVNYKSEKIYVSAGTNSTKFYFSQDKMKTWEKVTDDQLKYGIDISVFLKTSDNTIYFKGDRDKAIVAVTLPKEDKGLKVTYYVENGKGRLKYENVTRPLEFRKGTYGQWDSDLSKILDLSSFEITGYTLQFRLQATDTERAGRVVSVKIPKRQAPPKIRVDYSKMEISGLKAGQTLYQKEGESFQRLFAPEDSKIKTISLYELLFNQAQTPNVTPFPAATIEFQTAATDKKVASAIVAVEFQKQPDAPASGKILVDKTTVTFPEATKTTPYEYVVLHLGEKLDLTEVKWTKVTSNKPFEIKKVGKATPAPGDVIYYRLASTTNKETKVVTPASIYANVPITAVPITN